jgi:hypothetical protein
MTRNEKLNEISSEAFAELCTIADRHRTKRAKWGLEAVEKWWCVLYPAVHLPCGREFYTGSCFGLTFPTCDISTLPFNLGSTFTFSTREEAEAFGYEANPWFIPFLYPELILKRRIEEESEPIMTRRK